LCISGATGAIVTFGATGANQSVMHLPLIKKKEKKEYSFFSLHTLGAFGATVTFGAFVRKPCCCNIEGRVVPPFSFAKGGLIFTPHPVFCPSARISARNP
jgi:hypothetical protein